MPLNPTENYLRQRQDLMVINFAKVVTTSSVYMLGPGNFGGDGYPMPAPGRIVRLYAYDGNALHSSSTISSFSAGDRISLYAEYDQPFFLLRARINGNNSSTFASQLLAGSTLIGSLLIRLDVY